MSKYILPTLTITTNIDTATTNPGPSSVALSGSVTPADSGRITIDRQVTGSYTTTSSPYKLLDGHDLMTDHGSNVWTPGSVGCFLYMKNLDTSGTDSIYIGMVSGAEDNRSSPTSGSDGPTAPHATNAGH